MSQPKLLLPPTKIRPKTQNTRTPELESLLQLLGNNFSLITLLLVGACLQSVLVLTIRDARYALLPAFIFLLARFINSMLIHYKIKPNPYLKDVIYPRATTVFPNEDGELDVSKKPKVAILLLGAKSNHPFGVFSPRFWEVFKWFQKMDDQFNSAESPSGFLGQTLFDRKDERGASEFSFISYWRSIEDLHAFAHGPLHREAWRWWDKTLKENDCVGINHEIFEAPTDGWENVYMNFQPTGLGSVSCLKKGDKLEDGVIDEQWITPLVDASRGKLARSSARLGRDPTKYDADRPTGEKYA